MVLESLTKSIDLIYFYFYFTEFELEIILKILKSSCLFFLRLLSVIKITAKIYYCFCCLCVGSYLFYLIFCTFRFLLSTNSIENIKNLQPISVFKLELITGLNHIVEKKWPLIWFFFITIFFLLFWKIYIYTFFACLLWGWFNFFLLFFKTFFFQNYLNKNEKQAAYIKSPNYLEWNPIILNFVPNKLIFFIKILLNFSSMFPWVITILLICFWEKKSSVNSYKNLIPLAKNITIMFIAGMPLWYLQLFKKTALQEIEFLNKTFLLKNKKIWGKIVFKKIFNIILNETLNRRNELALTLKKKIPSVHITTKNITINWKK